MLSSGKTGTKFEQLESWGRSLSKKGMMLALAGACIANSAPTGSIGVEAAAEASPKPNILWITCEDFSPFLGCYGDPNAKTPNIDALANAVSADGTKEGLVFTNAFANAPICSPARTTIFTGMFSNTIGGEHHRSTHTMPAFLKGFPKYLRDNGYDTFNNNKTDYNLRNAGKYVSEAWNSSGGSAHYYNRTDKTKPFFQVYNISTTHESQLFKISDNQVNKSFPYHPDNEIFRKSWAKEYENANKMDSTAGGYINKLKSQGLWDDTIVFFYGDHGGVMPGMKRYPHDRGTNVPFVVRVPKKYQYLLPDDLKQSLGGKTDRLVSFVDLAPTMLSLTNTPIPSYMQGKAFMGDKAQTNEHIFKFVGRADTRFETIRAVNNKKYEYIRNYQPFLPHMQYLVYADDQPAYHSMWEEYKKGTLNDDQKWYFSTKTYEELYDRESDPHEIKNLAYDPKYSDVLKEMRAIMDDYQNKYKDVGMALPEEEQLTLSGSNNAYDVVNSPSFPYARVKETADMAASGDPAYLNELKARLSASEHDSVRYWAATGCYILKDHIKNDSDATAKLKECLTGTISLKLAAARVLVTIDVYKAEAEAVLEAALNPLNYIATVRAINILESVAPVSDRFMVKVKELTNFNGTGSKEIKNASDYLVKINSNPVKFIQVTVNPGAGNSTVPTPTPTVNTQDVEGIKVIIDGVLQKFDQPPMLISDRTMVPMRAIFETLGAKVEWEEATQTVTATKGSFVAVLKIGSNVAKINNVEKTLDVPATIINDRTLVPLRFVSESFGADVQWIEETETVVITTKK
ncbi:MAG: Protease inhibitor precursor [Firmicutes bacterium ADurb.Bin193]|nr:MAG: Protease inhibitor precursor [Firmicutes bacterium ADurb.Bin193]